MARGASKPRKQRRSSLRADPPPCTLRFCNQRPDAVRVLWLEEDEEGGGGEEREYAQLEPGCSYNQGTYVGHAWRLRSAADGGLLAEHVAEGHATIVLQTGGGASIQPGLHRPPQPAAVEDPRWGAYRQRGVARGIPVLAFDVVCQAANMLRDADPAVVAALVRGGAEVAVIGRHQQTCDLPSYRHLRGLYSSNGGGTYDDATRGLGGHPGNPTTSCGEENLLQLAGDRYPAENILVHELAHAVMDIGLQGSPLRAAIAGAYRAAQRSGCYAPGSYIISNVAEYWAEASQAWFHATVREDVTSGVTTREAVKQRDPQLASLLARVYGDGGWRYAATAPRKLGTRRRHGSRAGGGISNSGSGGIFQPYRITRAAARFAAAACCLQS